MGLPMENDLLATTSEQIMEPESKFGTQKNLLSLTFQSKHFVLIDHVIRHMTILLKILQLTKLVMDLRKEVMRYHFFIHINKIYNHVWNDSPWYFKKKTEQKHHFNAQI